ncbi:MFS transporter [Gordonia rubripertincta]|uniref:MFS transporter n=1 Tax=Gordonia rubripertincta TaxID=36822 RepID=UPI0015F7977D|nr:MFS transporter [Gordonia rubripertincta]QMU22385.1 MFS transporter [Gordonia rubripertincta]
MAPLHPHRAFWLIAATYVMVLFASAAPSPLYPVYQELWGFSSLTLTLVFAVYVVTMLMSLLTVGSLSDHIGRRPVLAVALVLLIASMVLFVVAEDVGTLLAARALQGLATGAAMGTLTATTVDLQPTARLGSTIVGAAPAFGLATGVGVAGLLVEYAPAPRILIYEVVLGLFAALLIALIVVPETRERVGFTSRRHMVTTLAPQVRVPREVRPVFFASAPTLVATWSLGGLYLSLGSSVVARVFGVTNHGAAGLILFSFFASATVTSLLLTGRPATAKQAYGYPALAIGVLISLSGVMTEVLPLYILGSLVAGSGWASTFLSAMDNITAATPPAQRGQVFSSVFVASYLAFSVPAVIAGIVVSHIGLRATVIGYVGYVLAVALFGAALAVVMRRTATRAEVAITATQDAPEPVAVGES